MSEIDRLHSNWLDLIERLEAASLNLQKLADATPFGPEHNRLKHKRSGVELALSYAKEYRLEMVND